ncbi:AAA family ATPase [Propionibacteriaceae bacterium Y1685]
MTAYQDPWLPPVGHHTDTAPPGDFPPSVEDRPLSFDQRVLFAAERMRVQEAARRLVELERRGQVEAFDVGTLTEVLARPSDPAHRVDGLIPWEASTLLTAQRKTGKTTATLNLARSLLTGEDFLGRFGVQRVAGSVALLNFEVSAGQLARWAHDAGVPPDRLHLANLRGRRNPLADDVDRAQLAALLRARGVEVLICDPFGRAYTGASQNDAGEVSAWLVDLDRFARSEVGATDLVLTAHAGWNGERTRGSSALEDWADVVLTLTRDGSEDGDQQQRYLSAFGRDVEVEEDRLDYEPTSRTLRLAGTGSRRAAAAERTSAELEAAVVRVVAAMPGVNGSQVERELRERGVPFQRGAPRQVLAALVDAERAVSVPGPRGAKQYSLTTYPTPTPDVPHGVGHSTYPTSPVGGGVGEVRSGQDDSPNPAGYVTCSTCGEPMTVVEDGQTTHPGCEAQA